MQMAGDPNKPLLRLETGKPSPRTVGKKKNIPRPEAYPSSRQTEKFGATFDRLEQVLSRDASGMELRSDATALAPERLIVFELRSSLATFADAIRKIPGLELIDEEEAEGDEEAPTPTAYLMVPDAKALGKLLQLWKQWKLGQIQYGETAWQQVFDCLRDLRPWGPTDRVKPLDGFYLSEEIRDLGENERLKLEIEITFRANAELANSAESDVRSAIEGAGGTIFDRSRIFDIAYHALLAELPVSAIRKIVNKTDSGLASFGPIYGIRAQSVATTIEISTLEKHDIPPSARGLGDPILAVLDGVPVAAHSLLSNHVTIDDQFELEASTPVVDRVHGTAMCSLIVNGDRNEVGPQLPRRIQVVPVLGAKDQFPDKRLIIDLIYTAVLAMREGDAATAPHVLIINLSVGNFRRRFDREMSPWARLLDRLAYRFGILFIVSGGNITEPFAVPGFSTRAAYEDADPNQRASGTVKALHGVMADRRLLSPAETVNGLTVGSYNSDLVPANLRRAARVTIDPYVGLTMSNPSSALGPGFALAVKPDILMPGAREHLHVVRNDEWIQVRPAAANRSAGLKVAAPPISGVENAEAWTNGTSAAAALASRTCHQIHDALEAAYGERFLALHPRHRAVLLKALIAHTAKWPDEAADLIRNTVGPAGGKHHVRQKDNIRRFLGYGVVNTDNALACADDRATFWAVGTLAPEKQVPIPVPIPAAIGGKSQPHSVLATLAWFTPVAPGRRSYRSVRLKLLEPNELGIIRVAPVSSQPDVNQTRRGTLHARCWSGDKAPIVGPNMTLNLAVQRDPDQNGEFDEEIPFGVAVTITMPGIVEIYEEVRQRLGIMPRATA